MPLKRSFFTFRSKVNYQKCFMLSCTILACMVGMIACSAERLKSDAELGLTAQQASGRRVYDAYCIRCHEPYSSKGKQGPSLKGVFKKPYLSESGMPANDERVGEIIRYGRSKMPGYSQALTPQQIDDLMAYLHTL
ncbi:MAG: cytochrome C [Acidobacteria bacterium]|nr:MAG: cytochrome C [Acidobacteriota bacterium]